METRTVIEVAEGLVRDFEDELLTPMPGECLQCFVHRQLLELNCDGSLRFAQHFRDTIVPRATALEKRLTDRGGFCDCEIFMNAYWPNAVLRKQDYWRTRGDGFQEYGEAEPPATMPQCLGVRRGSTQPCGLWQRIRRGRW